jgi:hypothetical protein
VSDVFYSLKDDKEFVYHYTTSSTLVNHILCEGRLRFSKFGNVNDPIDARPWSFGYYGSTAYIGTDTRPYAVRQLKDQWAVGCFVSDIPAALVTKEREDEGEDILMGPLHERGHARPPMWWWYAERHCGACLIFDRAKLERQIRSSAGERRVFAQLVEYRHTPIVSAVSGLPGPRDLSLDGIALSGLDCVADEHIVRHKNSLFFLKGRDWEHEREFRFAVNTTDEYFYVKFGDSLAGLLLGECFPARYKQSVGEYGLANRNLHIAMMTWPGGLPQPRPVHASGLLA